MLFTLVSLLIEGFFWHGGCRRQHLHGARLSHLQRYFPSRGSGSGAGSTRNTWRWLVRPRRDAAGQAAPNFIEVRMCTCAEANGGARQMLPAPRPIESLATGARCSADGDRAPDPSRRHVKEEAGTLLRARTCVRGRARSSHMACIFRIAFTISVWPVPARLADCLGNVV